MNTLTAFQPHFLASDVTLYHVAEALYHVEGFYSVLCAFTLSGLFSSRFSCVPFFCSDLQTAWLERHSIAKFFASGKVSVNEEPWPLWLSYRFIWANAVYNKPSGKYTWWVEAYHAELLSSQFVYGGCPERFQGNLAFVLMIWPSWLWFEYVVLLILIFGSSILPMNMVLSPFDSGLYWNEHQFFKSS